MYRNGVPNRKGTLFVNVKNPDVVGARSGQYTVLYTSEGIEPTDETC